MNIHYKYSFFYAFIKHKIGENVLQKTRRRDIILLLTKTSEASMNKRFTLSQIIKNGCVIFTFITIVTYALGVLIPTDNKAFIPTFKWIVLFFLFSQLLAFANFILKQKDSALPARLGLHFISCALLYFVTVVLCGGFISNGAQTLIAMVLFLLLYGIFAAIYSIVSSTGKKRANKKQEYDSMFR